MEQGARRDGLAAIHIPYAEPSCIRQLPAFDYCDSHARDMVFLHGFPEHWFKAVLKQLLDVVGSGGFLGRQDETDCKHH